MGVRGLALVLMLAAWPVPATMAQVKVRIKDITDFQGARGNQLVGFGMVVGLENTGGRTLFTQKMVVDMLQRFQVNAKVVSVERLDNVYRAGSVSAVMVTAELGPFSRIGSRLDVTVSVIDDATSLQGGTLILTPLRGADGVDYAVAQGSLSVGGFIFSTPTGSAQPLAAAQKNHPTVGRISGGAIVEREARGEILCEGQLRLLLREPDYATAKAIAKVINAKFSGTAFTLDAGTVQIFVPREHLGQLVSFVSDISLLEVTPDLPARVVISERTGTIVAGEHVKIDAVAVTHSNLSIISQLDLFGGQPLARGAGRGGLGGGFGGFGGFVDVTEQPGYFRVMDRSTTVSELARALNALGVTPRDMIAIFQALKRAGALHAELILM